MSARSAAGRGRRFPALRPPSRRGSGTVNAAIRTCPTEETEQRVLVAWLDRVRPDVPYYHVPNGGWRSKATAGIMKATGAKPGVPDLCFPAARGGWHGLYIEMKRSEGGWLTRPQAAWLSALRAEGYRAEVCAGADAAIGVITDYFGGRPVSRPEDGPAGGPLKVAGPPARAGRVKPCPVPNAARDRAPRASAKRSFVPGTLGGLRSRRRMPLRGLALLSGVSRETIRNAELGRPRLERTVAAVLAALGMDAAEAREAGLPGAPIPPATPPARGKP